jgi:hypothetical protein
MQTIQQRIAEKCLAKLTQSAEVDGPMLDQLQRILLQDKKLKVEDLVKVFSQPAGGDIQ